MSASQKKLFVGLSLFVGLLAAANSAQAAPANSYSPAPTYQAPQKPAAPLSPYEICMTTLRFLDKKLADTPFARCYCFLTATGTSPDDALTFCSVGLEEPVSASTESQGNIWGRK